MDEEPYANTEPGRPRGPLTRAWADEERRLELMRLMGGVALLVIGVLILVFPELVPWVIGTSVFVAGVLVLAYGPLGSSLESKPRPDEHESRRRTEAQGAPRWAMPGERA